jgi:malonate-semialdehyde dehydrogenase (acetylating)/methylmalonate-semialdehyde dehydrogenase
LIASELRKLPCFLDGEPRASESRDYFDVFDPSTGQVIAQAPDCTEAEVNAAVETAREAFPAWAEMPAMKRVQILFRFRDMI